MANQSRVDVDPNLDKQIEALRISVASEAAGIMGGTQIFWTRPDLNGWNGDLADLEGISKPFDRSVSNQQFVAATADPDNPGTTGDLVAATLQVDYLAVMERAFRVRHATTHIRAILHSAARRRGHGSQKGVFKTCVLEYIRRVVKLGKGETP